MKQSEHQRTRLLITIIALIFASQWLLDPFKTLVLIISVFLLLWFVSSKKSEK